MPRNLKVYQTTLGFYDSVVAAPSQAAALRAWGLDKTNVFKEGFAEIATDPQAIEAALKQPETPLRRPVGSNDPFSLKPRIPKASEIAPGGPAVQPAKAASKSAKPRKP